MQMSRQTSNSALANQLFADWFYPSNIKVSYSSIALLQHYQSNATNRILQNQQQFKPDKAPQLAQAQFQRQFVFGSSSFIWRKGKIKKVQIFIDPNFPSLLWISSRTKAFLFDLTYTTVESVDLQLQKIANIKDYIVLHYFQQSLPIVYGSASEAERYFQLFTNFIIYNKKQQFYPPYLSRILKLYTMQEIKDKESHKRKVSDVLKVSNLIGLNQDKLNWQVLQAVVSKQQPQNITERTQINHQQISQYFKILHCSQGVKELFQRYSKQKITSFLHYLQPLLSRQGFRQFLIHQQNQNEETIAAIVGETRQMISFYDFCAFLLSEKSNYACACQAMDEDLPLNDYFCYCSHNTNLSGNQLTSDSKIERYIEDLQAGVKSVELDVHNDGHRPIINHALKNKSLCKPIDFQETLISISRFADHYPNHYPIMFSMENYATETNRYKMVNMFFRIFGDKLFIFNREFLDGKATVFKKLSELKGRIIIKTDAKLAELLPFRKDNALNPIKCQSKMYSLPISTYKPSLPNQAYRERYYQFQNLMTKFEERKASFIDNNPKEFYLPLAQMTKVTAIFKSATGVENKESTGYQCTSYSNEKVIQIFNEENGQQKIYSFTKRSWMRVYPLGIEITSNNFNPIPILRIGAQLIALNTQTKDNYMWMINSYFTAGREADPARLGYVPKPLHLRSNVPRPQIKRVIQIKVISMNEKVSIKYIGTDKDTYVNRHATMTFQVEDYDQGFLIFSINQKFKDCLPLRFIRRGFRVLVAKNERYRDSGIRVLIEIGIKQVVREGIT